MQGLEFVQTVPYKDVQDVQVALQTRRTNYSSHSDPTRKGTYTVLDPTPTCLLELKCIQALPLIHRLLESGNLPKLLLELAGLLRIASSIIAFILGSVAAIHAYSRGSDYARAYWYPVRNTSS